MWFFTLTYANEHLPYLPDLDTGELYPSLRRADVKKMFHDVRQNGTRSGKSLPSFAWLYCGEYGPRTHRPHYHGCFIGLPDEFVRQFEKYWVDHFGFADFKVVPLIDSSGKDNVGCVARYIAKYISKPKEFELDFVKRGVVEKPRKVTSVGFGMPDDDRFISFHRSGLSDNSLNDSVPP